MNTFSLGVSPVEMLKAIDSSSVLQTRKYRDEDAAMVSAFADQDTGERRYLSALPYGSSRTTTSICEIRMPDGGSGNPSTRMDVPGISTRTPSRSI